MTALHKTFVLGSTNQAKRVAAGTIVEGIYGTSVELVSLSVEESLASQIPQTPTSDDEGINGALLRAKYAEERMPRCSGYIGLEGVINTNSFGSFLGGWAVVRLSTGEVGIGCSARVQLPERLMAEFNEFRKLSEITAAAFPEDSSRLPEIGTNGVVTGGAYTRVDEFTDALRCAFGSLYSKDLLS